MTARTPGSIGECDALLTITHNRYLAAVECEDITRAAELWIQLHDLLDIRIALPLPREPSR